MDALNHEKKVFVEMFLLTLKKATLKSRNLKVISLNQEIWVCSRDVHSVPNICYQSDAFCLPLNCKVWSTMTSLCFTQVDHCQTSNAKFFKYNHIHGSLRSRSIYCEIISMS